MPGRRPVPTALKELRGNPGHRPLNALEPQPERTRPEKPKGMGAAASREWDFMVEALERMGLLSNVDGKALAAYCDAYGMWEQARKEINKYGLVIKTPKVNKDGDVVIVHIEDGENWEVVNQGTGEKGKFLYELKANPAVQVYNTFGKLMKSYLIEFGLTPASRAKLKVQPPKKKDEGDDFMARKNAVQSAKDSAPLAFDTGKKPGLPVFSTQIPASATDFDA